MKYGKATTPATATVVHFKNWRRFKPLSIMAKTLATTD
jgi:hypothetical protein